MNKVSRVVLGLSGLTAAAAGGYSWLLSRFITGGKRQTLEEAKTWQSNHYDISWFDRLEQKCYCIDSYDGYRLHVQLCKNPEVDESASAQTKYVILTHGYTDNRFGMLKYMQIYLRRGFHCIIWDLRGHGENEPEACTYGIRESRDLCALIQDTFARYGQDIILGLHGESLGAATTVCSLGQQQRVRFAVADCGFSDITNVLKGSMTYKRQPAWLVDTASLVTKLRVGYSFRQMRPVDALSKNRVPVLFLHGREDRFIQPENSLRMQRSTRGYSEFHMIPGASHANSVLTDPEKYEMFVDSFLKAVLSD